MGAQVRKTRDHIDRAAKHSGKRKDGGTQFLDHVEILVQRQHGHEEDQQKVSEFKPRDEGCNDECP
jgi:hypothetical protein